MFVSKTAAEVTDETFDAAASRRIIPGDDEEVHAEANDQSCRTGTVAVARLITKAAKLASNSCIASNDLPLLQATHHILSPRWNS
jgi:hypothetical protein